MEQMNPYARFVLPYKNSAKIIVIMYVTTEQLFKSGPEPALRHNHA